MTPLLAAEHTLDTTAIVWMVIPGLATGLGGLGLLLVPKPSPRVLDVLLGFTAGIMLAATAFSLLMPALDVVWNYEHFITYVRRWVEIGAHAENDTCAPADGVCSVRVHEVGESYDRIPSGCCIGFAAGRCVT